MIWDMEAAMNEQKRGVEMIFSGDQNADLDRTDRQGQDE